MVKKICHFQIFKTKNKEEDVFCALVNLQGIAEVGQYEYPCNPKECPMYQSWKILTERGASLRML
jgi:hypothetical protein